MHSVHIKKMVKKPNMCTVASLILYSQVALVNKICEILRVFEHSDHKLAWAANLSINKWVISFPSGQVKIMVYLNNNEAFKILCARVFKIMIIQLNVTWPRILPIIVASFIYWAYFSGVKEMVHVYNYIFQRSILRPSCTPCETTWAAVVNVHYMYIDDSHWSIDQNLSVDVSLPCPANLGSRPCISLEELVAHFPAFPSNFPPFLLYCDAVSTNSPRLYFRKCPISKKLRFISQSNKDCIIQGI